ncbi:TonB-dependent receptor [Methylomicrobium sp. Wu6]|uniref:TonB-dependent receptor n=1 Tax=Methylomicrobium sp. Wu6 TaxID=3107928 RepID=UPI002DD6B897|nr:TonB-dependent receptor [Methylomicrobium sp. Wu6]MEC4749295.1 TonB-dependent receptor [Methylomicrobium sp. Wu6]
MFSSQSFAEENIDSKSDDQKEVKPSYKMPSAKEAVKNYNVDSQDKALLSPVTVTANSSVADELLSPKSVTIYSKENIRQSGVSNLLDFFKYNTEIQTDPSFGNVLTPRLSMRGFGNGDGYQNINIIVDGVSLNQIDMVPQQLGSVPIDSIEKIEVVKSSGSVLYGDYSGAGTIIIRTNNSFDRKPLYGSARSGFGTYNTKLEHINLGSVTDFTGFKVLADGNFTYLDAEGKKQVLADGSKDTTENVNGKATLGLQKDNFEIVTSFIKDDSNVVYTGAMTLDAFNQNPNAAVMNGTRNIVHKEDWVTALKYKFNDRLNAAYTYANKTKDLKYPAYDYLPHYEGEDHRFTLQSIQDDFVVLAGFDLNNNLRAESGQVTKKNNVAGFISADYFVNDRLSLNAGFRQAFITFKHDNNGLNNPLSKSVNPTSVNAAMNYSLAKNDALFTSYVHAFQSPDIDRFFSPVFAPDFTLIGKTFNGFINTMEMDTYSIGYKHLEDDLKVKAEFYYSDLNNEIYYNSSNFRNTNYDSSSKYGVELSVYKDFDFFYTSANYVYTDTRARVGSQIYQISAQPKHIVLATLGKQFTSSLLPLPYHLISLSHKYQSESYAEGDFDNSLGKQQSYNSTNFTYQLTDRQHWTVDFSIQNLFNGANGQFVDFGTNQPVVYPTNYQRTFQGSVSYRF